MTFSTKKLKCQHCALYKYIARLGQQELQKLSEGDSEAWGDQEKYKCQPCIYLWCLKGQKTAKHCVMKDSHAVVIAGMINKAEKALQKCNLKESKIG